MTTTTHPRSGRGLRRDPERATAGGRSLRVALAIVAPLAPLAIGVIKLIAPYPPTATGEQILAAVAAHPATMAAMEWLRLLVYLALIPGVIAAGLAAIRRSPRLATVALLVAVPAWAAALAFPDIDGTASALVALGTPTAGAAALLDHLGAFPGGAMSVAVLLFVVGHIVGTALLGLALLRSRAVPVVVSILLAISQPLHFVAFVILQSQPLDFFAYLLTAVGFGAAGIALLRNR